MSTIQERIVGEATHEWTVERIDRTNGTLLYIEGAEFPMKGCPTPAQAQAVNIYKRVIMEAIRTLSMTNFSLSVGLSLLFTRQKFLNKLARSLVSIGNISIHDQVSPYEQQGPFSRQLEILLTVFFQELGIKKDEEAIAGGEVALWLSRYLTTILEHDMAYRWRVQDLLSETTASHLPSSKEIWRLGSLLRSRDIPYVADKLSKFVKLASLAFLFPSVRRAFSKALSVVIFEDLQFDEGDRYWCCFRTDYKFFGLSDSEREQMVLDKGWKVPKSYPLNK